MSDLKRAINSIYQSNYKNFEIIVSDDSTDNETKKMISEKFPKVKYIVGPKKGLCFNRNNALKLITGSRVLFMDDDVVMTKGFLEIAINQLSKMNRDDQISTILTGIERNRGLLVFPNNIDFLGHQKKAYKNKESLKTIVINSTLFPSSLFKKIKFDEQLIYGYDEVDIATRAITKGYKIILCKEAVNNHYPSLVNRDYYSMYKEASRIYVTYKRYREIEKNRVKTFIFLLVSFLHLLLYQLKRRKTDALVDTFNVYNKSLQYIKLGKKYKGNEN